MSEVPGVVDAPEWLVPLVQALDGVTHQDFAAFRAPSGVATRHSAVLILFGEGDLGPDVLLIERASDMRSHAGQPAFPGGAVDEGDAGPVAAALREAQEETGLDPGGVRVLQVLPDLWLPPSGFSVTPVLGFWTDPVPVRAQDPREVARAERVPLADLVDPLNRVTWVHPAGHRGPGFLVAGMTVWGFTAMLLDRLLALGGWARPWAEDREVEVRL